MYSGASEIISSFSAGQPQGLSSGDAPGASIAAPKATGIWAFLKTGVPGMISGSLLTSLPDMSRLLQIAVRRSSGRRGARQSSSAGPPRIALKLRARRIKIIAMTKLVLGAALCAVMGPALFAATAVTPGNQRRVSFNEGWRFFKGEAQGAERPDFQDGAWTQVRLPHDWAIDGPFDSKLNPHTGALPIFGTGWYRKSFTLPASAKGRYISVEFDGAMYNSTVWINGHELGGRPYGYIGFSFDLTPYLQYGAGTNVMAVRLTPEDHSSRWYPGAGIYRNVWLDITGPLHVARWGTYVTTPEVSRR